MYKNDINFVNESNLFTQGKIIATTYMTTAREPSIYDKIVTPCFAIRHSSLDKNTSSQQW